jgi:colanic acid/amylovoran biosynthesis glycosyltransferase
MDVSTQAVTGSAPREGNRSLKIAFVVHRFPSLPETFILNQITGLLDRGHQVDIFATMPREDVAVHPDVERYNLLQRTSNVTVPQNLLVRAIRAPALLIAHARHPALLRATNIARYGRKAVSLRTLYTAAQFLTRYDIVHCQYGTNGEAVGALLKEMGLQRKIVTTFHRFDIRLAQDRGIGLFRRLLAQGDCVIAISESNRRQLLEWGFDPAKVVYHPVGIDCRVFAPIPQPSNDPGRKINIVTVARLVPQKAVHNGILAVSKLVRDRPDLRLRYEIAGGGPLHEDLKALIGHLGLETVVRLHGPLRQEAVFEILRRGHIFLLPSIDEITPVALMEAQAMGLPAIATTVGSTSEVVLDERSGFLVPPEDVEALAAKLRLLVEQPQLRVALGQYGSDYVRARFDINVLNDRLVQIYWRVLGGDLPIDINDAAWKTEGASMSDAFTSRTSVEGRT